MRHRIRDTYSQTYHIQVYIDTRYIANPHILRNFYGQISELLVIWLSAQGVMRDLAEVWRAWQHSTRVLLHKTTMRGALMVVLE